MAAGAIGGEAAEPLEFRPETEMGFDEGERHRRWFLGGVSAFAGKAGYHMQLRRVG